MKSYFITKKRLSSLPFGKLFLASIFLLSVSCENEEFSSSTETLEKEEDIQLKATPIAGKTYYLKNRNSGLHMDVTNKSNSNGAIVQQWGNGSGTHRQWQVLSAGNGYYRLKGVDSGKSLTVKGGSNSNGTPIEIRAYNNDSHQEWEIKSTGGGYYRLKSRDSGKSIGVIGGSTSNGADLESRSWNGNDKFEWLFIEAGGIVIPPPPPGGNTPGAILGLNENTWKLNGFTGSPGSNSTYRDDLLDAINSSFDSYEDRNYFYADGNYTAFKCYRGLGTSQNSGNPRVELREMSNGNLASWNGGSGNNTMTWTVRVDQLPKSANGSNGILCFGQIHGPSSGTDDLIRLQFEGNANQSSGAVRLKISGYITENFNGSEYQSGYSLDTEYTFGLQFNNGVVKVFRNGSEIFSRSTGTNTSGNYFKVGNYLQSSQGASFDGSYGIVKMRNLSITH